MKKNPLLIPCVDRGCPGKFDPLSPDGPSRASGSNECPVCGIGGAPAETPGASLSFETDIHLDEEGNASLSFRPVFTKRDSGGKVTEIDGKVTHVRTLARAKGKPKKSPRRRKKITIPVKS